MNKIAYSRMHGRSPQRGVTLIEMMVAMVISLVVSGVAATVFVSARQSARYAEALSRYQETLRFAQAAIAEDLRTAGQLGCRTTLTSGAGLTANDGVTFSQSIDGRDNWASASTTLGSIAKTDAMPGSDAIRLQFASRDSNSLSATMASASADISVANAATYAVTDPLIIADCQTADTFLPTVAVAGATTIKHNALSNAYTQSAAQVYRFLDRAYYIDTTKRLVQVTGVTTPIKSPIAEGIEELQFDYGVDTDADGYPNRYVNATDVGTAWDNVVAVRVCMLVSSLDQGLTVGTGYTDCDGTSKTNPDRRLRFPVTFTVRIRNRGAS